MLDRASGDDLDECVETTTLALRAAAVEAGMAVSGDDRVGESCAAKLLGLECETLAKRRSEGKAPPSYRVPVGGSRISYWLMQMTADEVIE
jgi:hypothetical protein